MLKHCTAMDSLSLKLFLGLLSCVLAAKPINILTSLKTGPGYDGYKVEELVEELRETRRVNESESNRHRHDKNETEFWGYIDVRPGAHMFYWLYRSSHAAGYLKRPLIIWIMGGPGNSGCGYGNFELIGPRGINFTTRSTSWVREASVLFVDNPVGTGFSYVNESVANKTHNIREITDDLISFTRQFVGRFPEFSQIPIYVFGESYGGKMAAHFANRLYHEAAAGRIRANVVGFSMGNSWIAPDVQTMAYGPMLYQLSLIDDTELNDIQLKAAPLKDQVAAGDYQAAFSTFSDAFGTARKYANGVDSYNFLVFHKQHVQPIGKRTPLEHEIKLSGASLWSTQASEELPDFMNGPVRNALSIIPPEVTWVTDSDVYYDQRDMMSSTVHVVEDSLINTTLQVIVMEGQLDVICNTGGAMKWVQTLNWPGLDNYNSARRQTLLDPDTQLTEAFVKAHDRFKFYWILGAGHSVAKDKGQATYRVLQRILGNVDK